MGKCDNVVIFMHSNDFRYCCCGFMDRRIHVRAHTGNVGLFLKRGADWDGIAKQHSRAPIALPMHTVSSCKLQ